jgi:hypothetical protein
MVCAATAPCVALTLSIPIGPLEGDHPLVVASMQSTAYPTIQDSKRVSPLRGIIGVKWLMNWLALCSQE